MATMGTKDCMGTEDCLRNHPIPPPRQSLRHLAACGLTALAILATPLLCPGQAIITTVAGGGIEFPGDGGPALSASLISPTGVTIDTAGNIYIVEEGNYRVRKVNTSGIISTVAGTGNPAIGSVGSIGDGGPATQAGFFFGSLREGIAVDGAGNLYITDSHNNRIRKVDTNGIITTVAGGAFPGFGGDGGPATSASLKNPSALAVDSSGNLYIADVGNARVRKVNTSGIISTVAGNGSLGFSGDGGPATSAAFNNPAAVAVDGAGNLYIGDGTAQRVRKVDTAGIITTVAGNGTIGFAGDGGPATGAAFAGIEGLAVDGAGNLYITDNGNKRVRKVSAAGIITTVAGTGSFGSSGDGGAASSATLSSPADVAVDTSGNVYIADGVAGRIRKVSTAPSTPAPSAISLVAGGGALNPGDGGPATSAMVTPKGVAVDRSGNVYIADPAFARIRKVNTAGIISTVAGNGNYGFSGDGGPATSATLLSVNTTHEGVAVDSAGNIYIADGDNNRIRKVDTGGIINTVAGTGDYGFAGDGGLATSAKLAKPRGVAVDGAGNLYIADSGNSRIRKVDASGIITTVAGNSVGTFSGDGGPATSAALGGPTSLAVDSAGNLYIADTVNLRIRKVSTAGIITTVAGTGSPGFSGDGGPATSAKFSAIDGVAVDSGGRLYITDRDNFRVRMVSAAGIISTIAGTGSFGTSGDGGAASSAQLGGPTDVAVDSSGNLYIADAGGGRVRKVSAASGGTLPAPTVGANGVVNAATLIPFGQPGHANAPGSIVSIFGTHFATAVVGASTVPLPTTLGNVSVSFNGIPAPLIEIIPQGSFDQINAQLPSALAGTTASIVVTTASGPSTPQTIQINTYSPGIFTTNSQGTGQGAVLFANSTILAAPAGAFPGSKPAKAGDVLTIYATGLGPVMPPVLDGHNTLDALRNTATRPVITVGGVTVPDGDILFSGLAPQFIGQNQINFRMPSGVPAGNATPIRITIGGVQSPASVTIATQ